MNISPELFRLVDLNLKYSVSGITNTTIERLDEKWSSVKFSANVGLFLC